MSTLIVSIPSPTQSIRHPNYNSYTINNDVAVIKLASPAQLNTRVSPVCLAETSDNFAGGMKCVTSGWGLTRYNGNGKFVRHLLHNTRLSLYQMISLYKKRCLGFSTCSDGISFCSVFSCKHSSYSAAGCSASAD